MQRTAAVALAGIAMLVALRAGTAAESWSHIGDPALSRSARIRMLRGIAHEKLSIGQSATAVFRELVVVPFPQQRDTFDGSGNREQRYSAGSDAAPALVVRYRRDQSGPYIVRSWQVQE